VRTRPSASLIWLLAAIMGLIPLHAALGATLAWNKLSGGGEELVFSFESSLPAAEPRQRGLTQIQIPIPWSFWQNERKPKVPNFSSSKLLKDVSINPDGVFIVTRSGDFMLSFTGNTTLKKLVVELYPPAPYEPGKAPSANASAETSATSQSVAKPPAAPDGDNPSNATPEALAPPEAVAPSETVATSETVAPSSSMPDESVSRSQNTTLPAEHAETDPGNASDATQEIPLTDESTLSGLKAIRSKIKRPDQATSEVRRPIDRTATHPEQGRETASQDAEAAAPDEPPVREAQTEPNASSPLPSNQTVPQDVPATNQTAKAAEATKDRPEAIAPPASNAPIAPETPVAAPQPSVPSEVVSQAPPSAEPQIVVAASGQDANASQGVAHDNGTAEPEEQNANASQTPTEDNSTAELEELYTTAQNALAAGDLKTARTAVTRMTEHPKVSESLGEELLYTLADITLKENLDDLEGNFLTVMDAYEAAKNSNLESRNLPEALSRMGYVHLFVGNVPEAKGYFDLLRRKFPDDPRVAMIDYYWGEHYLRRKDYARAAEHFQYAIQNFPMSLAVQPSTVGLLKAFTELGYFEKAMEIVDSVEKRWPRYYLSDPSFLMAAGYAAMLSGKTDQARDYFWAYANIVPEAQDADVAMARIGDILLKQGALEAAREIYHRTSEAYPDREGGLIAKMRLAEEGVLDQPSITDMDLVFSRPESNPEKIYKDILEHSDSPLAPVARLKLAMWNLWNKNFAASLDDVRRFQDEYPNHELLPKAREVADAALRDWITTDLEKEDFAAAMQHWAAHQGLYQDRELDARLRLMVATALMRAGQPEQALEMARPFVFGPGPRGEYSLPGMELTLAMQVELQQWKDVIDLSGQVASWDLGQERRRQVDYATALAHEKLQQSALARPLWAKLATDMGLSDTQRGYAHYFLGRAALAEGKLEQAAILGQEALTLLEKDKSDLPKLKETLELLIQAADRSGRTQDALAWTLEYDGYVDENDADWPAHTYRKALLFKKNSETDKWRENLNRLKELFPNSLHGRMAAAELEGTRIEREVRKFR
jgi:outer membrane protein assembly factor BamD (BamD/ComL family)